MEPLIKRSWVIDSIVIIVTAFLLSYIYIYNAQHFVLKFLLIFLLVYYFFGKSAQKYIDKKNREDKEKREMDMDTKVEDETENEMDPDSKEVKKDN